MPDWLNSLIDGFTGRNADSVRNLLMPRDAPIWDWNNPVGTETLQSVGMPKPTVYAGTIGQFINPATGQMTTQGAARMNDNPALGFDTGGVGAIKAFHGSPHLFAPTAKNPLGEFDPTKIGTGEGAQAYGVGAGYLAESAMTAEAYKRQLALLNAGEVRNHNEAIDWLKSGRPGDLHPSAMKTVEESLSDFQHFEKRTPSDTELAQYLKEGVDAGRGHVYEVNVHAEPEHFLHWDKPLSEQSQFVRDALKKAGAADHLLAPSGRWAAGEAAGSVLKRAQNSGYHAADLFNRGGDSIELDAAALSQRLQQAGIPGIRYLDAGSRGAGEGSHNLVVFSPETMEIIRRYGLAGLMAGGAAAAASGGQQQRPEQ